MTWEQIVKILVLCSALLYYASAALYIRKNKVFAYIVNAIAWLSNASVVAINWVHNGYVPFISMYQVLTFLGVCFTLAYLYIIYMYKYNWTGIYFSLCSGLSLTGVFFMDFTVAWNRPPALQSVWFIPHVFSYMLSYSLAAVAFVMTIIWFFDKKKREQLEGAVYRLICISFPFMTAGMLLGALWADQVWGDFWSWDLKENWSLITWLLYTLFLHSRRNAKLKKYTMLFSVLGFLALVMTFVGVNLVGGGSSMHAYN
ncbi:MAG: cytochrome c assembly protein [Oscillospiraceae bacterium]|jgi:ABC-type transport system involved in cytochrome c biogenesis permease subunit|nr:cytochrome c assembly protein [Oscillospiraceae bacterium]